MRKALRQSPSDEQIDSTAKGATSRDITRPGTETILVVDDEDAVRDSLRLLLETSGYTVLEACGGSEAIEIFRNNPEQIAMAIIDRQMQPMSGDETLSQLKSIAPDVRAVFISGHYATTNISDSELGWAAGTLPKPPPPEDFWRMMRHVLDNDSE